MYLKEDKQNLGKAKIELHMYAGHLLPFWGAQG